MNDYGKETELLFAPEPETKNPALAGWKVLIVDDEVSNHDVTVLALRHFVFDGRGLNFLHAYSAAQAREILQREQDIALMLVDVVMESEHAGLDLVHWLRNEVRNKNIRIVLRTGQPGQAPELTVIRDYDINDYKEKTELTVQKLYSTVFTSLRAYRDVMALEANRRGLIHIIQASGQVSRIRSLDHFIQGTLEQLTGLLYLDNNSLYMGCECMAVESVADKFVVVAATGKFESLVGKNPVEVLEGEVLDLVIEVLTHKKSMVRGQAYVGFFATESHREDVIYLTGSRALDEDDLALIEMFMHNVSIAYENALLRDDVEATQRDMVYMLGEAVERRSQETGQHVRRVGEYCRIIALGIGMTQRESEILHVASPLHDFGKIGIPDHILHKPGKLTPEEWNIMQSHARMGADMLMRSPREILQAAAILAGQHHERWDGSGYPDGLAGEQIHLYARIGAVADVFDALASRRSYKEAWRVENIFEYITHGRGKQFDPVVVDWVLANKELMTSVLDAYPDSEYPASS